MTRKEEEATGDPETHGCVNASEKLKTEKNKNEYNVFYSLMDFFRGCFLKLQGILYHGVVVRKIKTSTCHVALIKANDKKHMQVF